MEERWFIDAWSVFDGMTFASLREPNSTKCKASVFLCPPYFEPESMSSLATAKAATRHAFQDGFRDAQGVEIPFVTLDQIVEATRLAYRAAAQADPPTGTPLDEAPPEPQSDPDIGGAAVAFVEYEETRSAWDEMLTLIRGEKEITHKKLDAAARWLVRSAKHRVVPAFVKSVFEKDAHSSDQRPRARERALATWAHSAIALGVGDALPDRPLWFLAERLAHPVAEEFHHLSIPTGWIHAPELNLSSLYQAVLAVSTDRLLLLRQSTAGVGALVSTALLSHAIRPEVGRLDPWQIDELEGAVAAWLVDSLPSGALRGHAVEHEISLLQRAALAVRARAIAEARSEKPGKFTRAEWEERYLSSLAQGVASEIRRLRRAGQNGATIIGSA